MNSFRNRKIDKLPLPPATVWLLSEIAEAKGRQGLFAKQTPELLKVLREAALIQSVESSNRIEGIVVQPNRLLPLVMANARPKDRSEEEIQGYRKAMSLIHTQVNKLKVTPDTLLRLHKLCQQGAGDAGKWKRVDNDIVELRPNRPPVIRFRTVPAASTKTAIKELCSSFERARHEQKVHPLLLISALILDFLCIHPFRDGNGRVSRLLTLLLLYQEGYEVGRYISLEKLVEETKEDYYEVLNQSSQGWHKGGHDLLPWHNYLLSAIRRAYRILEERASSFKSPRGAKTTLVQSAIDDFEDDFTVAELKRNCPGVSHDMVRRVLKDLSRAGKVKSLGRGRGAKWRKKRI